MKNFKTSDGPIAMSRLFIFGFVFAISVVSAKESVAQSGLLEALEKLDTNDNKHIDPQEITSLARPYLERIGRRRGGFDLYRPIPIQRIRDAARLYYSEKNGSNGRDVRPEIQPTVKPFGPERDEPIVPGFGIGKIRFPYIQEDIEEADRTMRRCDQDDNGFISRKEALRNRWTHRDPFADDFDKDDRLSHMELTQRYARRRLVANLTYRLGTQERRRREAERLEREQKPRSEWWRKEGNKSWLTASLMGRFDSNRNGTLEFTEASAIGIPVNRMDMDSDGVVTRDELQGLVTMMQEDAGDMNDGLPGWFYELDADRDGQVALSEFSSAERPLREFTTLDKNADGLLTYAEAISAKSIVGGNYANNSAEVLPPKRVVVSEIEVEDDFLIGDVNVELSVTHSHVGHLDAFLISPSDEKIELFTEIGGGGDNIVRLILDDQAGKPVVKGRPPFEGSYQPESLTKKQPSLSKFNGQSCKGVWKLEIRGVRSDRFGMLHRWGLAINPTGDIPVIPTDTASTADAKSSDSGTKSAAAKKADLMAKQAVREAEKAQRDEEKRLKAAQRDKEKARKREDAANMSGKVPSGTKKDKSRRKEKKKDRKSSGGAGLLDGIFKLVK